MQSSCYLKQRVKRGEWTNVKNQQLFFDNLAKKLGIKHPKSWGTIPSNILVKEYGAGGVLRPYGFSLSVALKSIYPSNDLTILNITDEEWNDDWFVTPKGTAKDIHSKRKILEDIAKQLHIKDPMDWGNIPYKVLLANGIKIVLQQHKNSLLQTLQFCFPGT